MDRKPFVASFFVVMLAGVLPIPVHAGFPQSTVQWKDPHEIVRGPSENVIKRPSDADGTSISATSLAAPKTARKAYEKGLGESKKEKWDNARKHFETAVKEYPRFAAAWCELGFSTERLGDMEGARKAYAQSISADGKFIKPYLHLANVEAKAGNWKQLADTTAQVLRLDPYNYPGIYYFDSVAHFNLRHLNEAEKSARETLKRDPQNLYPGVHQILGLLLAVRGELAEAANHLRTYLKLIPAAPDAEAVRKRLSAIEAMAGNAGQAAQH